MDKKVIIAGKGGDGVKHLSKTFAKFLTAKNYEVTLTFFYDAAMSGGDIYSNIVFSKTPIENPLIEKADILIEFSKIKKYFKSTKKISAEEIHQQTPCKSKQDAVLDWLKRIFVNKI